MKPTSWKSLPYPIRFRLVNMVDIEFCRYESSAAEAVEELLCDTYPNCANDNRVQDFYETLDVEQLVMMAQSEKSALECQISDLNLFIAEL